VKPNYLVELQPTGMAGIPSVAEGSLGLYLLAGRLVPRRLQR